ncbi:MAG TPA: hypothetical protein VEQ63_09440, partial [Bryobacteraceae bacterium]|nr:hypothetical protein [Bryobacteraceae bacterium]
MTMIAKAIVLLILVLVGEQSSNAQTPAVPPKPAPPKPAASKPKPAKQQVKPASTPLQLEDVIFLLQGLAAKLGAEDTVLLAIKTRGLGFRATREAIDRIDANSPPPAVRALLLELMGPLPPPPVVAPKTGTFSISCVPAECELSMNGKDLGRTTGGKFVVKDEPFGPKVLQAVRSGYISDQRKVDLVAGMVPSVEFKLEPTGETKQAFGKQILGAMRSKLGMEEPGSCDLTASGST